MKRFLFRLGAWCMSLAGEEGGTEYLAALSRASHAEQQYYQADQERWRVIKKWQHLLGSVRLADGLLSSGKPAEAQKQLRYALRADEMPKADADALNTVSLWD